MNLTSKNGNSIQTSTLEQVIINRRSIRAVANSPVVEKKQVEKIIQLALASPSSFNMQSSRLVVLMGESHTKLWNDIVLETLREVTPVENFPMTETKLKGFASGAGTILYFEDQSIVKQMQIQAPLYKDLFPHWSEHNNAILQYAVWLGLEAECLGGSLQHYNPIIDDKVRQTWGIPSEWKLIAQMPFGTYTEKPQAPEKLPIDKVVRWY